MNQNRPLTHLGHLSVPEFLQNHWQKGPLLIKQALPDVPILDPDVLAGLTLEDEVESRLVLETPADDPLSSYWEVRHGPLDESLFTSLPDSYWTLLVQGVDQLSPEIYSLLQQFRFLPNWRVDDIMVSYAADKGGVGPHFDYYDVFLIQAQGQRRWKIGQGCGEHTPLRDNTPQKILTEFNQQQEYLVETGDILYIPAGVAHWGIADGECVTYSVGFRAPSLSEVIEDYSQFVASHFPEDLRFSETEHDSNRHPGLITRDDIQRLRRFLLTNLDNEDYLAEWFGTYMTTPKRNSMAFISEHDLPALLPSCRAAFAEGTGSQIKLFVNGETLYCSRALAEAICSYEPIDQTNYDDADRKIIQTLEESGYLA